MPWPENTWSFDEGDQFTTIIFHKASAMPGHAHMTEIPQHLAITGHYIPHAGEKADYWFVLPSSNVDWSSLNSINWFHVLTHFGGPPVGFWSWPMAIVVLSWLLLVCVTMRCCWICCSARAGKTLSVQSEWVHVWGDLFNGGIKYSVVGKAQKQEPEPTPEDHKSELSASNETELSELVCPHQRADAV